MRVSLYRALPILPALLITLAGCASAQPPIQELAARCAAMGYRPGSEALANCTERQATAWQLAHDARAQASAVRWAQLGDAMQATGAQLRQPPARSGTTCIPTGRGGLFCQ